LGLAGRAVAGPFVTAISLSLLSLSLFGNPRRGGFGPVWGEASLAGLFREAQMGKKLYVGNLTYETTASDLEALFGQFGTVQSAQVIADRDSGRSKGFGFVEMGSDQEAQAAIAGLSGKEVNGRSLTVNEAKPREDRGGGRGGYGGGGGGRGGYGGKRDRY